MAGAQPDAARNPRAMYADSHVREALERDLEARIVQGYRNPPAGDARAPAGGGRRARTANRWVWANNRAPGGREEGLNELGEAPPPYEGRTGSAHKDEDAVEMENLGPARRREDDATGGGVDGRAGAISPPAYSAASTTALGGTPPTLSTPPPVALQPGRMNHLYG